MILDNCKWLPKIVECKDYTKWNDYLECIYEIFKEDFIDNKPIFEGKVVNFRKAPMDGKYEHTFIHLTHKDEYHKSNNPNDRVPDIRRAERIGWNRAIRENYNLLITGYYVEYNNAMKKYIKKYEKYKMQKTPLI